MTEHTMQIVPEDYSFLHAWMSSRDRESPPEGDVYLRRRCGVMIARSMAIQASNHPILRCPNYAGLNAPEGSLSAPEKGNALLEEKPEVVVLDDEEGVLNMLCDFLEMEGFRATCLNHPRQIECLKPDHHPCLFLIDMMLPGTNGLEVAAKLRQGDFGNTPMIAMSASTIMVHSAKFADVFEETISKPFDLSALRKAVERYAA
jgi:CheY-like chemotaxis protein